MTPRGKRAWRWIAGTVAALAVVAALLVVGFRLVIGLLPEYEVRVAETVRTATGLRLTFESLDARIGWYGPEIYFAGARIVDRDGEPLVTARAGRASLSLLRSAWYRRLEVGRVILEAPRLNVLVFPDRHIELVGQAGFVRPQETPRARRGLERVPRGVIEVRDATVAFRDLGAGGTTWELTSVDLEMRRKGDSIDLQGDVDLPKTLGRRMDFEAHASGNIADPAQTAWRVRLAATDVDLAGWAGLLPDRFPVPSAGAGSFRVSARGTGRSFERGRAALQLTRIVLPGGDPGSGPTYTRLAGELTAERDGDTWRVSGRELELSAPDARWRPTDLTATVALREGRLAEAWVRTGYLRAGNLVPMLSLLPATPLRDRLQALGLRGTLRDVDLRVKPAGPRQMPDLTGSARFEDVGFERFGRFPGVDGADGRFEGAGAVSTVHLDAGDVTLDWPIHWRTPMPFQRVRATVELTRALGGLRLATDDAEVVTTGGEARGRLRLLARPGTTTLMDLDARATVSDVSAVSGYLTREKLTPRTLEWLDRAFVSGRVPEARVQITGPLRGFPYREGQGRFVATARVEDLTLDYAPGWMPVTGASAEATFDGPSLRVAASAGNLGQIGVRGAWAELADWREALLVIRANVAADAGAVRGFFASSPLAPRLGSTFERLSASGPLSGEVAMYLPIKQFSDRAINVHGMARGVSLALDGVAEPVTGVEGEFWVRDREFFAPKLTGELLGGAAEATVTSRRQPDGDIETRIDARGMLEGARLPHVLRLPLNAGLAGTTRWRGDWTLERPAAADERGASRVRVESDLVGLASGLPAPLAKEPGENRPLTLDLTTDGDGLRVRAGLGRNVRALLELRREAGRLQVARGTVRLGGGEVGSLPVGPGLTVDGRLPYLSISDLTSLTWSEPGKRRLEDLLAGVTLDVGRLEVLGYEFDGVSGRLRPGNRVWDIEVRAPAAEGRLRIPYSFPGDVPLVADLERLTVSPRVREPGGEPDPARLPGMRLDIRDLVFLDWKLGHLDARIDNVGNGVSLEEFTARHPAFVARGSGAWRAGPRGIATALRFELDSGDVRGLLDAMALAPAIEARKGRIEADVTWPGGPDATLLQRMSGKARIVIHEGRVLSVEPGAGRILGLMSLAHLGRRLALDFEDLTGQGMAFDSVKGDFTLSTGVAFTDNLTLRGPAADVGIAGRTDLRDRTYDQTAVVTGDLGASLGVAGAIAGGPAVGAALLLFSQIFKEPLKGVARAYYRITGPWDNPLVRKIDARELEDAAGLGAAPAQPAASGDDARG